MTTETTSTKAKKTMTTYPFPVLLDPAHREAIDAYKAELNGKPTFTSIIRAALTEGFKVLAVMSADDRARLVRGF